MAYFAQLHIAHMNAARLLAISPELAVTVTEHVHMSILIPFAASDPEPKTYGLEKKGAREQGGLLRMRLLV